MATTVKCVWEKSNNNFNLCTQLHIIRFNLAPHCYLVEESAAKETRRQDVMTTSDWRSSQTGRTSQWRAVPTILPRSWRRRRTFIRCHGPAKVHHFIQPSRKKGKVQIPAERYIYLFTKDFLQKNLLYSTVNVTFLSYKMFWGVSSFKYFTKIKPNHLWKLKHLLLVLLF